MKKRRLPWLFVDGVLPPGDDYAATLAEVRQSLLVKGPKRRRSETWDEAWRSHLVDRFTVLARQLWSVGIHEIFIDGSFAEEKDHPGDIDGYFVCAAREFDPVIQRLNVLDPYKVWTWNVNACQPQYPGSRELKLPMWHIYRTEMFPHWAGRTVTDIKDEHGQPEKWPAAFRKTKVDRRPKGIVRVIR